MSIVRAGPGLMMNRTKTWVDGEEITVCELSLDGIQTSYGQQALPFISPQNMAQNIAQPGNVLMIDEQGQAKWGNPMNDDRALREAYPSLEDAWQNLLAALQEYELAKKLVQDHDG